MKRMAVFRGCLVSILVLLWILPAFGFDFSNWDGILKQYVAPKTIDGVALHAVRYRELAKDPAFAHLVKSLETVSLESLKSREEKLAFWINTYNVMAAKMVIDHYPLKSIKDAGSFLTSVWKKPVGIVGGKKRTLNEIEHQILRKMGEPRIHVAIVCASVSCPDLRTEAYHPDKLNEQLNDQMTRFLANSKKGLLVQNGRQRVYLSSIFKWFKEDFESQGGVLSFLAPYAPPAARPVLKNSPSVSYLDYNWKLNE